MQNNQIKVVLVEDSPETAEGLQRELAHAGYHVIAVAASLAEVPDTGTDSRPDLLIVGLAGQPQASRESLAEAARRRSGLPVRLWRTQINGISLLPEALESRHTMWLYTALNTAADGIVIVDSEEKVQYLNPVAQHLTGWTLEEASGQHYRSIMPFEQDGHVVTDDLIRLAMLNEEPLSLGRELALISRDGRHQQIEAEVSAGNATSRAFGAAIFTMRDITLRSWEEKQQRQEQTIRAVERLAETTAHSLSNLLTRMLGNGDLLLHSEGLSTEQRDLVAEMNDTAQKITSVVRQLSNISRTTFVTHQELNINDAITSFLPRIESRLAPGITIECKLDPKLRNTSADPGQIEQILFSLISNAREAISSSGTITINTHNVSIEPPEGYRAARQFAAVTVRDSGEGMSKETLTKVFDPFFTTRKQDGHVGLGLSVAQGLIRDYKGFLDISSQPGSGTEVKFGIPALEADPFAYIDESQAPDKKTILVVEDDHPVRLLIRKILERHNYRVLEARDGEEALLVADLHQGHIDVVVSDVQMPRMTGPELIRQFVPLHPETKFLLISGFSSSKIAASSLPPDIRFLPKPFNQKALMVQIQSLLSEVV